MRAKRAMELLEEAYPKAKHLLRKDWLLINEDSGIPSTGFCYIATEALFYLIGGLDSGYKPVCLTEPDGTHWWLQRRKSILDPTLSQYDGEMPRYHDGRKTGFLNGYVRPSRRAAALIEIARAACLS
jgi:hypothetical protein